MKKQLLGTTALVAAGMFAMVDIAAAQTKVAPVQLSVGGYYREYLGYVDQDDVGATTTGGSGELGKFDEQSDKEIIFNGRTTLDNGLTIGFAVQLEANTEGDQIDESFLFMEGTFGRLELGSTNNAHYKMAYKAPEVLSGGWLNEGNIVNWVANPTGSPLFDSVLNTTVSRFRDNDSEKVSYYTPRFAGFQVGASYMPDSSQDVASSPFAVSTAYTRGWAAAINFVRSFGAFDVAAYGGYMTWQGPQTSATTSAPDPDQYSLGLQLGFAGFKVGGSYGEIKDGRSGAAGTAAASAAGTGAFLQEGTAFDFGVSYTFGPAAVSLNYFQGENDDSPAAGPSAGDDEFSALALQGKYTLGPGVSLEAVLFHAEFEGNTAGVSTDENQATGLVTAIVLVF